MYDTHIHIYFNTKLVTVHSINKNKINYHSKHYELIAKKCHVFKEENIKDIAIRNLEIIG